MIQRITTLVTSGVLALALFGVAAAGPYEDGAAAFQRGDYTMAMRLLRPFADQGDVLAQFILGFIYDNGRGVPQDYAQAVAWYRKAAEQGNAKAQVHLGWMYVKGGGVPKDVAQARAWFRKAADHGETEAQFVLGEGISEAKAFRKTTWWPTCGLIWRPRALRRTKRVRYPSKGATT